MINDTPGRVGPSICPPQASIRQYSNEWLDGDGYPFWSLWENARLFHVIGAVAGLGHAVLGEGGSWLVIIRHFVSVRRLSV